MNANDRVGKSGSDRIGKLPDSPFLQVVNGKMTCPYCFGFAPLVGGLKVYPNRADLASKQFYRCAACDAHVGCHQGTTQPLGRLANAQLRRAKQSAHAAFDPLWKEGGMTRIQAYQWLASGLRITEDHCHIGMFTVAKCDLVVRLCESLAASKKAPAVQRATKQQ